MRRSFILVAVLCAAPEVLAADLVADVAAREYHASRLDQGWQAPNRAQGLRTSFHESGIRVVPRTAVDGPAWSLGLTLARWGRSGGTSPVEGARLRAQGPRVDYDRGPVGEWYVNAPRGLEQGFTLGRPPEGAGPVQLEMDLTGTLHPSLSEDGQAVNFALLGGERVLRYADLAVRDARDATVPARLELFWGGVRIVIEDAGAVYPLTVDPVIGAATFNVEGEQAGAQFGASVASAGDVNGDGYADLLVVPPSSTTARRTKAVPSCTWARPPAWPPRRRGRWSRTRPAPRWARPWRPRGTSTAMVTRTCWWVPPMAITSWRTRAGLRSISGLPAVSPRSPSWTIFSGEAGARLGTSVGTAGDVNGDSYADVIVGAPLFDLGQVDEGIASVYLGSPSGPSGSASWTGEGNQTGGQFGSSVGTAGDVNGDGYADVIVGAPAYDGGQVDEGRAFVYHGSAAGLASAPAWSQRDVGGAFGTSVGTAGDVNGDGCADVIVGAPNTFIGHVSVYLGSSGGLAVVPQLSREGNGDPGGQYGLSVAAAGDVNGDGYADVIVGAPRFLNQHLGGQTHGQWSLYLGSRAGVSDSGGASAGSVQNLDLIGNAVAAAGDVNGDGYGDLVVGSPAYDGGLTDEGRVQVYLGSAENRPGFAPGWSVESDPGQRAARELGGERGGRQRRRLCRRRRGRASLRQRDRTTKGRRSCTWGPRTDRSRSAAGMVGGGEPGGRAIRVPRRVRRRRQRRRLRRPRGRRAPPTRTPRSGRARVRVPTARPPGPDHPFLDRDGGVFDGQLGSTVAGAGDVNGDGYAGSLVASPVWSGGGTQGTRRRLPGLGHGAGGAAVLVGGGARECRLRRGGQLRRDVNGDGFSDVILGAFNDSNGQSNEGRAYVYLGSATGLATSPVWIAESNQDRP
jgi:hypothetical protein